MFTTVYRNTTGKALHVNILFVKTYTGPGGAAVLVGASNPPGTRVGAVSEYTANWRTTLSYIVLPNYYYKAIDYADDQAVSAWFEWH